MASYTIDLTGDDDDTEVRHEEDPKELARREAARQQAYQEILRRMPQPSLQIVAIER